MKDSKGPIAENLESAGLFAGIAGFERGFSLAGVETVLLCESDELAQSVLKRRFPDVELVADVKDLMSLPERISVVTAGFPCQDLSMAGSKSGIAGSKSAIIEELFRLLEHRQVPWVVIENVYFMLHLAKGAGMALILKRLEELGYSWAYRVVDARSFGIAQRRRRVFIVASTAGDPRSVLLVDDADEVCWPRVDMTKPIGFYWTEGRSGSGLTGDAIPPLKSGSAIGIPSPPAVLLPSGRVVTPTIEAAERLQGFRSGWTSTLRCKRARRHRWRLLGNAVPVPVARWIGNRLLKPGEYLSQRDYCVGENRPWPTAAYNVGEGRVAAKVSLNPVKCRPGRLSAFATSSWPDLSKRALSGFIARATAIDTRLKYPDGFLATLIKRRDEMDVD